MNTFFKGLALYFKQLANIKDAIDTQAAARNIRQNIYFRGPNVWILAFSIVIASVGLNVNSTAVIIGAMLISPLMGPILGIGLGLGINDTELLKEGFRHLLVMVTISLIASFLFFFLSPLKLANPTELLARTTPTFYDVLIAFFGGCAGMLENSRKEKGTVLSGVAIATALMPPLCTAGYGLANFVGAEPMLLAGVHETLGNVLADNIGLIIEENGSKSRSGNEQNKESKAYHCALVSGQSVPCFLKHGFLCDSVCLFHASHLFLLYCALILGSKNA